MTTSAKAPRSDGGAYRSEMHRNEIVLVGELAAPPQARTLPSGDEVLAFRLTVRSGPPPGKAATAARLTVGRSDSIDCAAWRPGLQTRLQRCAVGDLLEVNGALRHRYWRGAGGLASRYEIEADRIRVVTKAPAVKAPAAAVKSPAA